MAQWFLALRPHQWIKNTLVALPAVAAHRCNQPLLIPAFVCFCMASSAIYLFNDIIDAKADRKHPTKKKRPIASGAMSYRMAYNLGAALVLTSAAMSWLLPLPFSVVLGAYLILASIYSSYLKSKLMLDVVALAVLYGIRVWGGGMATHTFVSDWLIGFCLFLFLSLAILKRCTGTEQGRAYTAKDLPTLMALGISSGLVSVLTLALYINSPDVLVLYRHPEALWMMCLILTAWIGRAFLLAGRGKMPDDPVAFAITDKVTWLWGIAAATAMFAAMV